MLTMHVKKLRVGKYIQYSDWWTDNLNIGKIVGFDYSNNHVMVHDINTTPTEPYGVSILLIEKKFTKKELTAFLLGD